MHRTTARARFRRVCSTLTFSLLVATPVMAHAQDVPDTNAKIRYKGLTITPAGFFAGEAVFRSRNETADIGSNFNNIPFSHTTNANLTEFRGSARHSRLALGVEGKAPGDVKLSGYWESDFLTVGTNSNSNESNSYALRLRQFRGRAAFAGGFALDVGQMWSLSTANKKGIQPGTEQVPNVIDAQYNVGFDWARQWSVRITQSVGDKAWFALAAEEPQMTFGGHGLPAQIFVGNPGGSQLNATSNYSTDIAPDVIAKIAVEPGFGHWEIKGIGRLFRDRVVDTTAAASFGGSRNIVRAGGGVGVDVWFPFIYEKRDVFDIGVTTLWGTGIGRYGSSQLIDATAKPDGTIAPIRAAHALLSIEAHPSPKLDLFAYGGVEYEDRTAYLSAAGKGVGYGSPLFNNAGCEAEVAPTGPFVPGSAGATCTGDTRALYEGTIGFWYNFYRGSAGRITWGLSYSYLSKNTWVGAGGAPQAIDGMAYTSFRYYLP